MKFKVNGATVEINPNDWNDAQLDAAAAKVLELATARRKEADEFAVMLAQREKTVKELQDALEKKTRRNAALEYNLDRARSRQCSGCEDKKAQGRLRRIKDATDSLSAFYEAIRDPVNSPEQRRLAVASWQRVINSAGDFGKPDFANLCKFVDKMLG